MYSERLLAEPDGEVNLAKYLYNTSGFKAYHDNDCQFFPLGEDKWDEMKRQLEQAQHFIFMEYFIVADGKMWDSIVEILARKASEGVEVRFMYDGMNSLVNVSFSFYKKLSKLDIDARPFSQIRPALSTVQNNRDHRKILVIDGKVAFTGGINLADEYINEYERFGHWKDTAIMVKGDAVRSFTCMFLTLWNVAGKKSNIPEEELDRYVIAPAREDCYFECDRENAAIRQGGFVIPYADSPFADERIGKQVYIDILNRATDYVHIMTPYLILDDEMIRALSYAALRGVEVIIIMPHVPDKKYAYFLARSYYKELLLKGVKIYEYTPGFVHAKEFVSDGMRGTVGSVNLDYRSLYLHFECGIYIYDNGCLADIEEDFKFTLSKCQEITVEDCNRYSKIKTLTGKILRLISPLM
jgi:cardiolipin synthase